MAKYINRKPNWKISIFLYAPFLVLFIVFIDGGIIGSMIGSVLAYISVYLIIKLFKIDPYVYYDLWSKSISKTKYEKLDNKVDFEDKSPFGLRKKLYK